MWGDRDRKAVRRPIYRGIQKDVASRRFFANPWAKRRRHPRWNEQAKAWDVTLNIDGTKGNGERDKRSPPQRF